MARSKYDPTKNEGAGPPPAPRRDRSAEAMEAVREQNKRESADDIRARVADEIKQLEDARLRAIQEDERRAARARADREDQLRRQNPGR